MSTPLFLASYNNVPLAFFGGGALFSFKRLHGILGYLPGWGKDLHSKPAVTQL